MNNPYVENGYENRKDYLQCLSEDYGVPYDVVVSLAQVLGADEDFDGLVSAVEDAEAWIDRMEDEQE
jgi:hypothetical protein